MPLDDLAVTISVCRESWKRFTLAVERLESNLFDLRVRPWLWKQRMVALMFAIVVLATWWRLAV